MDTKKRKNKTLAHPSKPSSSRRHHGHVASPAEWRDWASLPSDVLWIVFTELSQTDVLRGAGLVCSPWRRLAVNEPLLWRHIDLRQWHTRTPLAVLKGMAYAALDRSTGRCESFAGDVDADVLFHLANSAPLLENLSVTEWPYIPDGKIVTESIIKKLPMLERLVLSGGDFDEELLLALLDHCPRLELLDAYLCRPMFSVWEGSIWTWLQSCVIKDLRLPDAEFD